MPVPDVTICKNEGPEFGPLRALAELGFIHSCADGHFTQFPSNRLSDEDLSEVTSDVNNQLDELNRKVAQIKISGQSLRTKIENKQIPQVRRDYLYNDLQRKYELYQDELTKLRAMRWARKMQAEKLKWKGPIEQPLAAANDDFVDVKAEFEEAEINEKMAQLEKIFLS